MVTTVKDYVEKYHMLQKNDRVVIGISGGADSVCLLFVLLELREIYHLELVCVHVNHNLRGDEAIRDQNYVEMLCNKYNLPLEVVSVDVNLIAKQDKISVEEAGRNVRREAFRRVAQQVQGSKIATAHHENDNAETFLINLLRGTGISGLRGIAPIQDMWIRPLLCVSRLDVERYLDKKQISYCIDSTNLEDVYTRNVLRNQVIPILENHINCRTVSHMNDAMEELGRIDDYIQQQVEIMWNCCIEQGQYVNLQLLGEFPDLLQEKLIKRLIESVARKSRDITRAHVTQLLSLKDKQVGKVVHLPYGLQGRRGYGSIVVEHVNEDQMIESGIQLSIPGETLLADGSVVTATIEHIDDNWWQEKSVEILNKNPYTKYFNYDIIKDTLNIRKKCFGDEIVINENGNRQSLKKYFTNNKVPLKQRDNIPLLVEGNQILWIVGLRKSEAYNITKQTKKILKVQFYGGNHGRNN